MSGWLSEDCNCIVNQEVQETTNIESQGGERVSSCRSQRSDIISGCRRGKVLVLTGIMMHVGAKAGFELKAHYSPGD